MGGRRSYSIKEVIGSKRKFSKELRELGTAIKNNDPKKIVDSSTQLILKSDYSTGNLAMSMRLANFVVKHAEKPVPYKEGIELASKSWSKIKSERKIKVPETVDRIIVESAAMAIRRRKRE